LFRPHFGAFAAEAGATASIDASPATAQATTITLVRRMESLPNFYARDVLRVARERRPYHLLLPERSVVCKSIQLD
jgi:hypothetical protein